MEGSAAMLAGLRATLGKLEVALGAVHEGIAWTDLDGRIQWCNSALDRMLSRPHIEILGVRLIDILPLELDGMPLSAPAHPASMGLSSKTGGGEGYVLRLGEPARIVDISWEHISLGQHEVSSVFMVRDVTERARLEKELTRSNADLGFFAAAVSHDLQEPLRKIISFGDLLERHLGAELDGTGRDFLQRLREAASRMSNLIQDILELAHITRDATPYRPVDLNTTISEVLADLEIQVRESKAEIEVGTLLTVFGHPSQMRQLFQNLIANAIKFCRKGAPPRVTISSRIPAKGFVEISVADNGIGFEEKYLEKIFQPFRRLNPKGAYKGSGLGLAICHSILIRHGGDITAKSTLGKGSTFIITLPSPV